MCTRRSFLKATGAAALMGPALLEQSARAAAQARAAEAAAPTAARLFDLQKLAEGLFLAQARPQLLINSNACVIVNDDDVMVVDTHSKPSAARALISQIRREVTTRPVRYIVNSHFHWDHIHGNHAYPTAYPGGVHILTSEPTRKLMAEVGKERLQGSLDDARKQLEDLRRRLEKAGDARTRATIRGLIAQGEAYLKEMPSVPIDLPTTTFDRTLTVHKKDRDIHLMFLGRGHTAGDVVVFLPKEKVVATGDLMHGFLPWIADAYPAEWPATLDKLRELDFDRVSPGHAGTQEGKAVLGNFRNYVEELTGMVREGIQKGRTLEELQKEIQPAAVRSLQADGYGEKLRANYARAMPVLEGADPFAASFAGNIEHLYQRLKA